jgi:hypothetical protein
MRPTQFSLRSLLLGVLFAGFVGALVPPMDALSHGPYSSWYNARCQKLADDSGLVGRPERDVVGVLGQPSFSYRYPDVGGKWARTYNYAPCNLFPTAKFQVHCVDGVVVGVEQFDD